MIASYYMSQI